MCSLDKTVCFSFKKDNELTLNFHLAEKPSFRACCKRAISTQSYTLLSKQYHALQCTHENRLFWEGGRACPSPMKKRLQILNAGFCLYLMNIFRVWNLKIQNSFLEFPKEIHPDKERALQRSERDPLLRFWNLPGLESFLCLEYSQLKRQIYYY